MKEAKHMLMVLEEYQLRIPSADTKTMPTGLRKEVRTYCENFVGNFSRQVKTIRSLKKKEFLNKHEKNLKESITSDPKIQKKIKNFREYFVKTMEAYKEAKKEEMLTMNRSLYCFDRDERNSYYFYVSSGYVTEQLDKEFDKKFGEGFKEFNKVLEQFEKKIEKSLLFGTVTDVYKLIEKYDKFTPFITKLSELQIK